MPGPESRPPSVDALARSLAESGLPHPLCVEVARSAIADGDVESAPQRADALRRTLLTPVVNATGVLLHTNLGRAPIAVEQAATAQTVEFDLATGQRGSRQTAISVLFSALIGAEAAIAVNNNAAAVMLVLAALAEGREVAVSRSESVEIGGSFRIPDVIAQSGCRLLDVGTTNRTRAADYQRAVADANNDVAAILKVHPSNYRVEGFVETASVKSLASLGVPLVVDLGSGLLDSTTPWLSGPPPTWLGEEPAAKQTLAEGADLVTFSGDKLLGGPQAGIIAGRRDLIERCARHPLMRALRCGGLVLGALQRTALAYLERRGDDVSFWQMVATTRDELRRRAEKIAAEVDPNRERLRVVDTEAIPGAGSAPGVTIGSVGIAIEGDHVHQLREHPTPIIARERDGQTIVDLRAIDPTEDAVVTAGLRCVFAKPAPPPDPQ